MLKMMTWVGVALSIAGGLADLTGRGGEFGPETAAEIALVAKVLGGVADPADPMPGQTVPPPRR